MNNKIFYIMGKSGSGKDTMFKYLTDKLCKDYITVREGINPLRPIIMNTTRPMRDGEINGQNYNFVSEETMHDDSAHNKIIECRKYDTVKGEWYYYTSKDSIDLEKYSYIGLGTPVSFNQLGKVYGNSLVPIMLSVEDNERFLRLVEREKEFTKPDYLELCRRFVSDESDFSVEKVRSLVPCDIMVSFENVDQNGCCMALYDYIIKTLKNN